MYLPTQLPAQTEWALMRRSDRLLAVCFAASVLLHLCLGLVLARLHWSRPEAPSPRFTEVRLIRRSEQVTPPAPPRSQRARPAVPRPRTLSLYLNTERPEPPRRRSRRSGRRAANAPLRMAARPAALEAPAGSGGLAAGPASEATTATVREPVSVASERSLPGSFPPREGADRQPAGDPSPLREERDEGAHGRGLERAAPVHPTVDAPRHVAIARRASPLLPDLAPVAAPSTEEPVPPLTTGPERSQPTRLPAAPDTSDKRVARLPERLPAGEEAPRVLTGPVTAPDGVPEARPVSRSPAGAQRTRGAAPEAFLPGPMETSGRGSTETDRVDTSVLSELTTPATLSEEQPDARRDEGTASDRRTAARRATTPNAGAVPRPGLALPLPLPVGDDGKAVARASIGDGREAAEGPRRFGRSDDRRGTGAADGDGPGAGTRGERNASRLAGAPTGDDGPGGLDLPGDGGPDDGEGGLEGRGVGRLGGDGGFPGKGSPGGVYVSTTGRYLLPGAVTGSNYLFHVNALSKILDEINSRTKLQVRLGRQYLRIRQGGFRNAPVVVFSGHRAFTLNDEQRLALRQYVEGGGMLWADFSGGEFDDSFRDEMERIFGKRPTPLPMGHTIYRAFYVLTGVPPGDLGGTAPLEGISVGDRLAVVITPNRYFAAVGGPPRVSEAVQEGAFQVAVNIYVYAAANYRAERE